MMKLYGVPGWGSTISEVMLTLADIPYQFVNVDGFDQPGPQRELLQKLNPLCQVPTLALAIQTAGQAGAGLVIATDPDCVRIGVAVQNEAGGYTVLTGNEVGLLLLQSILAARKAQGTLPPGAEVVKTIVTSDHAECSS